MRRNNLLAFSSLILFLGFWNYALADDKSIDAVVEIKIDQTLCNKRLDEKAAELCMQYMSMEIAKNQKEESALQNKISEENLQIARFGLFLTFLLSAFTVLFSIKSFKESAKFQVTQSRAYVGAAEPEIAMTEDLYYQIGITLKNTGNTIAHKVKSDTCVGIFPRELRDDFSFPPVNPGRYGQTFIASGEKYISYSDSSDQINKEKLDQLNIRSHCIYVWGEVLYSDCFGKEQKSRYAYRMEHTGMLPPKSDSNIKWKYFFVGSHNEVT